MSFQVKKVSLIKNILIIEGILNEDKTPILVGDYFYYNNYKFLILGILFVHKVHKKNDNYLGFTLDFSNNEKLSVYELLEKNLEHKKF